MPWNDTSRLDNETLILDVSARRDSPHDFGGDDTAETPWLGVFRIGLQRMAARYREAKLLPAEATSVLPGWLRTHDHSTEEARSPYLARY